MLGARVRARFAGSRSALIGAIIVAVLVVFAVAGPGLARHGPLESDFVHGVAGGALPVGPSASFPFGADRLFRDVFARLAWGARLTLVVASAATLVASATGALVGITAGWYEGTRPRVPWPALAGCAGAVAAMLAGRPIAGAVAAIVGVVVATVRRFHGPRVDVDGLIMRVVDALLAFPFLLIVLAISAALDRATAVTIVITLGATGWLGIARMLRAKTMQVRALDYVQASRALGQPGARLVVKHVLPNVAGLLIVTSTVLLGQMIVADSILGYLGAGESPPTPTWGRMLLEGQDYYATAPWLVVAPGAAILLAVWGFNLLGDGLRDALDPGDG